MNNNRRRADLVFLTLLALPLFFLACANPSNSTPTPARTGHITLFFQRDTGLRHIGPALDMEAAYFDVSFTRTGAATVSFQDLPSTTTSIDAQELLIGDWTATVIARNAARTLIGQGSTTFTVEAGVTKFATVTVSILPGTGTIGLSASWPEIALVQANLEGTLSPVIGTEQIPVSFSAGATTASFSSTTIPAGSYLLNLTLKDGTQVVSRLMDTVQILKGEASSGSITFTRHPDYWGRVNATVTIDLPSPIAIGFSAPGGTADGAGLAPGSDITISSRVSTAVDSYRWYLNGSLIAGESGSSLTIGQDLPAWSHLITLVVQHGMVLASKSYALEVALP